MSRTVDDLLLQRGRLLERIAMQRSALQRDMRPVSAVLQRADAAIFKVRNGVDYVKRHPALLSIGIAVLLILRGKKILQLGRRAFSFWQFWRRLRGGLWNLRGGAGS